MDLTYNFAEKKRPASRLLGSTSTKANTYERGLDATISQHAYR